MFIEALCAEGGQIYLVGGAVRNMLINLPIKDIDLLVRNIELVKLTKILNKYGTVAVVGKRFGVIKYNNEIDIALPRTEFSTGPGYKDFKIVVDHQLELFEDFKRRDATINAMGIQLFKTSDILELKNKDAALKFNKIIDPFGGIWDIQNKLWRAVGDPFKRFIEDPTRIMRALRQCAELGFTLEEKTAESIKNNFKMINDILSESIVRITEELVRLVLAESISKCYVIDFLFESGIASLLKLPQKGSVYLKRCSGVNLRIKMACLLDANCNREADRWTREFELSAAPHFNRKDVAFIMCVGELYPCLLDIGMNEDVKMRRLIQKCEKLAPNNGISFVCDLITYHEIITFEREFLRDLYSRNKDCILKISDLKLDGNTLREKYGVDGCGIKIIKERLFACVTEGYVENIKENLIMYLGEKNQSSMREERFPCKP